MKYSELERHLKNQGCYCVENGANHPIWYSPITNKIFPLSYHKSQEIRYGTLRGICKKAGVKL